MHAVLEHREQFKDPIQQSGFFVIHQQPHLQIFLNTEVRKEAASLGYKTDSLFWNFMGRFPGQDFVIHDNLS